MATYLFASLLALIAAAAWQFLISMVGNHKNKKRYAPCPPSIPIMGHIHLLRGQRHQSLARISARYGDIVRLKIGARPALLVSSPSAVEECLSKNDVAFSNRPSTIVSRILGFDLSLIFLTPHGRLWREQRKVAAVELLTTRRFATLSKIRTDVVQRLVNDLVARAGSDGKGDVFLSPRLFETSYSMMLEAIGMKEQGEVVGEDEAMRFREIVMTSMELIFAFNPADFFPFLCSMDVRGLRRRVDKLRERFDSHASQLLKKKRSSSPSPALADDKDRRRMVDALLSLQEEDPRSYPDTVIQGLMMLMVSASHPMAENLEMAVLMLLCNPECLERARAEVDEAVGNGGRLIEESDISNLPYIHCVVQETLRLFPPSDGMPPRECSEDCTIRGFHVPRGTMLFVNVWWMHRDPAQWENPNAFVPDRFLSSSAHKKKKWEDGEGFRFLPFGAGRRQCPGDLLSMQMMSYTLATLIQCFDWELSGKVVPIDTAMEQTSWKRHPLRFSYQIRDKQLI